MKSCSTGKSVEVHGVLTPVVIQTSNSFFIFAKRCAGEKGFSYVQWLKDLSLSSREKRVISKKDTVLKASLDLLSEERWDERKTRRPRIAVLKIECIENPILNEKCMDGQWSRITWDEIRTQSSRMALLNTDCVEPLHLVL